MPSFFRTLVLQAAEAGEHGDAIRDMRREAFEGILVRGVYGADECARLCARLEADDHGLLRTSFPAPFRAFFLGANLNLTPPDLEPYFKAALEFRAGLARLFQDIGDLEARVTELLSQLDGGRRYRAAPTGPGGPEHMFTTLRAQLPGGYIPRHFDNEQTSRPSYRFIVPEISSDLFSFVLAFSRADDGGALEVFNLRHGGGDYRMVDGPASAMRLNVDGVESVRFRLEPGDLILFNSGRYLHEVTPVKGQSTRWTACSFMAESHSGDVFCWG